jgi:hypothetical protein
MRAYADDELAKAAGRIWTEGRANPIDWEIRTPLGTFAVSHAGWQAQSGLVVGHDLESQREFLE